MLTYSLKMMKLSIMIIMQRVMMLDVARNVMICNERSFPVFGLLLQQTATAKYKHKEGNNKLKHPHHDHH